VGRRRLLRYLTALVIASASIALVTLDMHHAHAVPRIPQCTPGEFAADACPRIQTEITNDSVELRGNSDRSTGNGAGTRSDQRAGPSARDIPAPEPTRNTAIRGRFNSAMPMPEMAPLPLPPCEPAAECAPAPPPVTLDDLASFAPVEGAPHMEPSGWSVAGLPTNFWITTSSHVVDGELFDRPASVRFTPAAARYSYGDGTAAVRTPLGSSWAAAGAAEFSSTATSHTYANTGVYTVTVGVDFTVEYSYNGSTWVPVEGTLTSTPPPLTAQIVRANTVIVGADCAAEPAGIGC
jgi:hypothetical protein